MSHSKPLTVARVLLHILSQRLRYAGCLAAADDRRPSPKDQEADSPSHAWLAEHDSDVEHTNFLLYFIKSTYADPEILRCFSSVY